MGTTIRILVVTALGLAVGSAGCGDASPPTTTRATSSPATLIPTTSTVAVSTGIATSAAVADELGAGLARLALDPGPDAVAALPFGERVWLGLGPTLIAPVARSSLAEPARWRIEPPEGHYRASVGPFSALDTLQHHLAATGLEPERALRVIHGEHTDCFGAPAAAPPRLARAERIAIQPADGTIDSCIQWFSVDAFVQVEDIVAVTLDVGEP